MHALIRNRGLVAAPQLNIRGLQALGIGPRASQPGRGDNPRELPELMAALTEAFADHKVNSEQALNDLALQVAAMKVGGIGDGFGIEDGAPAASRRKAISNLGKFGRTGRVEDLQDGFQVNNAMATDSDPDGGYLAPSELSSEIIRIQRNSSAMRRLARVVQTTSGDFKQPFSLNNAASGWVGERESRPETDGPDLALVDVPAGEVYANPAITQKLLDDSAYDLGAFISAEIGDAFTSLEGAAFISGDGINKPRGFTTYPIVSTADASRAFGQLQYVATGEAADFIAEDPGDQLINLVYSLSAKYRQNAKWLMNSTTASKIRKFKDDQDNYLWQEGIAAGQPSRLLGYEVEIDEDMSSVGANAYPVAFGDFQRGYLITDRVGLRILRDPYTNKPYVMFYATKRVGGGLLDSNAIKLLKCATS